MTDLGRDETRSHLCIELPSVAKQQQIVRSARFSIGALRRVNRICFPHPGTLHVRLRRYFSRSKRNAMSSPTSNSNSNSNDLNDEEQSQRKRTRVRSHPDEETARRTETETEENSAETNEQKNDDVPEGNRKVNLRAKRQRLHVEIDEMIHPEETTNDSTTTAKSETGSAEASSTTTEEEEEEEEDEEDEEETDEDEDEQEEFKPPAMPPTKNLYLTLRQREFGIHRRMFDRTTCRAFHDHMIANRTIIQKMKVSHTLDGHEGCVNALAFNRTGR